MANEQKINAMANVSEEQIVQVGTILGEQVSSLLSSLLGQDVVVQMSQGCVVSVADVLTQQEGGYVALLSGLSSSKHALMWPQADGLLLASKLAGEKEVADVLTAAGKTALKDLMAQVGSLFVGAVEEGLALSWSFEALKVVALNSAQETQDFFALVGEETLVMIEYDVSSELMPKGKLWQFIAPSVLESGDKAPAVRNVEFDVFSKELSAAAKRNIGILLDVPVSVTVELGRTNMLIKDILDLNEGSIIQLNKLAGETVDLLVNDKMIASGEVVVIDENFGVRITKIIDPVQRVKSLN